RPGWYGVYERAIVIRRIKSLWHQMRLASFVRWLYSGLRYDNPHPDRRSCRATALRARDPERARGRAARVRLAGRLLGILVRHVARARAGRRRRGRRAVRREGRGRPVLAPVSLWRADRLH